MIAVRGGLCAILLALVSCGRPPAPTGGESGSLWTSSAIYAAMKRGTLRIAIEPGFPRFEQIGEDGELEGFDVDLAHALADMIGAKVEFTRVKWESIIPTLLSGDTDLIISGMTATPERALKVSYSEPYFHTILCLLVSKERASAIKHFRELDAPGKIVAVKRGTTGDLLAQRIYTQADVRVFKTENAASLEVAQGGADAFLYDLSSVRVQHAKHADTTFVLEEPVSVEPYAIACRKGDPETVAWLNLALRTMRLEGRLKELYEKHGLEDGS